MLKVSKITFSKSQNNVKEYFIVEMENSKLTNFFMNIVELAMQGTTIIAYEVVLDCFDNQLLDLKKIDNLHALLDSHLGTLSLF